MDKLTVPELWQKMAEIGLDGWIDVEEGEVIRREVENLEPGQVYLEVGVAYGKSLATACLYAYEGVKLYGIDILNWQQRDDNLEKLGVKDRAVFIEGDSQQEAITWKNGSIDLLFIDGNHTYYGVISDLLSWLPLVRAGGRVMLHDYCPREPGVMRTVHNFIVAHPAYKDQSFTKNIYTFTKR